MSKHSRYTITLLAALAVSPATVAQTSREATEPPTWAQSAQADAEASRQTLLKLLKDAQARVGQPPQAFDPSGKLDVKGANEALLKKLDEAQKKLADTQARLAGSPHGQTLELAQKLLRLSRARLVDDPLVEVDSAKLREQILATLESAQRKNDELRGVVADSPNAKALLEQLDRNQEQLDLARSQFSGSLPGSKSGAFTEAQTKQLYERVQKHLDQARAKVATSPNADALLKRLDEAQRRLDEARGTSGVQSVPATN